ncbi:hypothetical protein LguiA_016400 [Lonicera macranthoides]
MATAISRKSNLRHFYRYFSSYSLLNECRRSTKPSPLLFHGFSDSLHKHPLPVSQSDICFGHHGIRSLALVNRFLCTNAPSSSVSQANSSSKGSSPETSKQSGELHQTPEQQGQSVRGAPVSWLSFALLIATGAGLIFYYDSEKKRHIEDINTASTAVKQGPSAGKAAIGGPFNLVNHDGKSVTEKDFLGKWTLIYFGFTHCPDICPDELQKLASAIDKIKEKARIDIVPVFISVDPERDTVEQVREYVKEFHPNLVGLTGNPDEIRKAARAYRVYYMKTEEEGSDYLVDHSIIMYLMDPNMDFVKFFGKNNDVEALTDGIIKEIKQYKKVKA